MSLANVRASRKGEQAKMNYLAFSDNSSCTLGKDDILRVRSPCRLSAYRSVNSITAIDAFVGVAVAIEEAVALGILLASSCLRDA